MCVMLGEKMSWSPFPKLVIRAQFLVKHLWAQQLWIPLTRVYQRKTFFSDNFRLYIMGFDEEFRRARGWVADSFNLLNSKSDLSVFETTIRFVGGLLSSYALTKDQVGISMVWWDSSFIFEVFLDKARAVADLLLPAFDASPTGIPLALINVKTGRTGNYGWASGGCSILSEFGSLELEFDYLSRLTENQTYSSKATRIREFVTRLKKPDGLYPVRNISLWFGDELYFYIELSQPTKWEMVPEAYFCRSARWQFLWGM